jgi:hypothetical protein
MKDQTAVRRSLTALRSGKAAVATSRHLGLTTKRAVAISKELGLRLCRSAVRKGFAFPDWFFIA